jgi:hypothetical protein
MFSFLHERLSVILIIAVITLISFSAQAADLLSGKWELNLEKSKFTNAPAPKSETRTYEVAGDHEKMTAERINADGKPVTIQFSGDLDGKDYPYTGNPVHDTIAMTPVDALTTNYVIKGKLAGGGTRVISKDGKTLTISFKGTDPKGQPVEVIYVFDKR